MSNRELYSRQRKGKPIRPPKKDGASAASENWELLGNAIREIHRMNAAQLSFEELYRTAYNMVLHKHGRVLYEGVREVIAQYLQDVALQKVVPAIGFSTAGAIAGDASSSTRDSSAAGSATRGAEFLTVLNTSWKQHTTCLVMIRDILMYMDLYYAKPANVPSVYDLGLDLFRDHVIRTHDIKNHLYSILLRQIQLEREGEIIDRSAFKTATEMLLQLPSSGNKCVYESDFEGEFLKCSSEFYKLEGQLLVDRCDASEYLKKVEKRLSEEDSRTAHYLHSTTKPKICEIVERELISAHLKTIIQMENSGIVNLLNNDKHEDLKRMYHLFARVSTGLREMRSAISESIKALGNDVNQSVGPSVQNSGSNADDIKATDSSKKANGNAGGVALRSSGNSTDSLPANGQPATSSGKSAVANVSSPQAIRWVEEVLHLKAKFDKILVAAVENDKSFETAFNAAFEVFVNDTPKSPEFLSLFIDEHLKKGLKGKTEDESEKILDRTISLFRFIKDKDVFERYYKQHLAKRLLYGRSISNDSEKQMITKLKIECGYQFTSKLEGMFNDMRTSADTIADFKKRTHFVAEEPSSLMDISVQVLTATYWPIPVTPSLVSLPTEVTAASESFTRFYLNRHSGRKLTWQMNMGNADIKAHFDSRSHDLNVSTLQMVILMLFNKHDSLTYKQIQEETDIGDSDLRRNLQSLACAKYKVLVKTPKSKEIATADQFSFNNGFTASLARIKIQTVASKPETEVERKEMKEKVDEARKHIIEAAIVRVMKHRKTLDNNNLVAEVTKQLQAQFQPNPSMIKKRIEALIEREFLERHPTDRKSYNYLA